MAPQAYCSMPLDEGLTCLRENLVLLRKLSEDKGPAQTNIIFLYQCRVCQGLYKYIYTSSYQSRNYNADEGWYVYTDHYFKVGERNEAGSVRFPMREARIYGYRDESQS